MPPELVATFSLGLLRFFQGDFISATYILTPLLEGALRHVLKMYGYDVAIFDDAKQTQQDRTISSLFEQMRDELDEVFTAPITTDVEGVFLSRNGPHLRHDIAHALRMTARRMVPMPFTAVGLSSSFVFCRFFLINRSYKRKSVMPYGRLSSKR